MREPTRHQCAAAECLAERFERVSVNPPDSAGNVYAAGYDDRGTPVAAYTITPGGRVRVAGVVARARARSVAGLAARTHRADTENTHTTTEG